MTRMTFGNDYVSEETGYEVQTELTPLQFSGL